MENYYMASLNRVLLMGNLTRDIEMRYTPSGLAVAQMGLAMNRKFRDTKTNELREEVTFVDIDAFGKTAETAHQYLSKGRPVFVEGRLKLDQWDDKQTGQKRTKLKVVAERIQFVGGGQGQGGGGGGGGQGGGGQGGERAPRPQQSRPNQGRQAPPAPSDMDAGPEPEDLDIPEENIPF
jgi:single-strand DNA-binding protein